VRVSEYYKNGRPTVSLELYPPKTPEAEETLFRDVVPALARLAPSFFSVTYGAGGGTRATTLRVTNRIRQDFAIEAMAHLTCSGSTRDHLASVLDEAESLGIENVLALRGDPPKGETTFAPVPGGFHYAIDLLKFIRDRGGFGVGVAGYPEGHIECPNKHLDWDRTADKVEQGAEFVITQLFYDAEVFLEFVDYLRNRRGVTVPIIPGILPFLSAKQVQRFTKLCGARIPETLGRQLDRIGDDDESVRRLGVEVCTEICRRVLAEGAPGLHLYCLNLASSCSEILQNLGLANHRS
jgi:methylenetetrahydrofolate reductase (NADPH)